MPVSVSLLAASGALRVASLNLCTDEYLLLLARRGEIASVSRLSHDPQDSPLWREARMVPANRGTLESALPARPNLLLTMGGGGRASTAIARRMGLRSLDLAFPATIDEVEANMIRVAGALGDVKRADRWRHELQSLRATPIGSRDAIFLGGGGTSVGAGSLSAGWMRLAGLAQRPLPGGRVTLETLAVHPPRLLLRSTYRRHQVSLGQRWLDHPLARRRSIPTAETDGRPWTCGGPMMLQEIKRLRGLL